MTEPIFKEVRNKNILLLVIIAVVSILIRLLMEYNFDRSALLYVGIPFLIAITLLFIERPKPPHNWKRRYVNIIILSLVIMLGSSVILFEGFLCVVMFMPIYFFIVFLMFLLEAFSQYRKRKNQGKTYTHVLPLIIICCAFEGVIPELSFDREYEVVSEKIISANIDDIKQQLKQPMELNISRHWLLTLFPMPYDIEAGTLVAGDIHTINFRYHRWFVTNTHEGNMKLEISQVEDNYIRTRFVEDTSYISNYLKLYGTEIHLTPVDNNKTKVTLKIKYQRLLDPVWYFGPLQEYAIEKSAQFLLDEVITPKDSATDSGISLGVNSGSNSGVNSGSKV